MAHIDHGKSTLADRFLEITGTIEKRKMREQFLDMHPLEREKGITIKMQPVRMIYHPQMQNVDIKMKNDSAKFKDNPPQADTGIFNFDFYILNLIDTPGHVDFTYEVSRALAAVEGAILLVDATQGVQAQTLANLYLAQKEGLTIIPAINKIDLASAEVEKTEKELAMLLGVTNKDIFRISAKEGTGVEDLLKAVIARVPPPRAYNAREFKNDKFKSLSTASVKDAPLRALIFDSKFDPYQGVIVHVRVFSGKVTKGERIRFVATGEDAEAGEVGFFLPERAAKNEINAGEIGYIATGIKEPEKIRVGDTVTNWDLKFTYASRDMFASLALPGYRKPIPMVFASLFPENQDHYELLRDALKKLQLEDAALTFEPEESSALGRGYRAGFLGMLHMEIISERLKREYALPLIFSNPSVVFEVKKKNGEELSVYSAVKMPPEHEIEHIKEPWVIVEIVTPSSVLGGLSSLIHEHGGQIVGSTSLAGDRMTLKVEAPLREIIIDFYDKLKSVSTGFASMSYVLADFRRADLVKLDILVAGEKVLSLGEIIPREKAYVIGRARCAKLKDLLPRQLFQVAIQAEVGGKIIARESISAMSKDVTKHMYGGDRTRKMKLWKKQQRGKQRLKESAHVEIPPEVFLKMLKK